MQALSNEQVSMKRGFRPKPWWLMPCVARFRDESALAGLRFNAPVGLEAAR